MKFNKKIVIKIDSNFKIGWRNKKPSPNHIYGKIVIGDFSEHFYMSQSIWSIEDYKKQWDLAWKRLEIKNNSLFIVNFDATKINNAYIDIWCAYKRKNIIYIQNKGLSNEFFKKFAQKKDYTPETSFDYIPRRRIKSIEGFQVSEWQVKIIEEEFRILGVSLREESM